MLSKGQKTDLLSNTIMMKSITLSILFAMLALFSTTFAQQGQFGGRGGGDPYERADRQTERMKTELGLNEEQTAKVSEINIAAAEKMMEARQNADGDRESMRESMMAIRQETTASLKEVLTEEQWTKFETLRQQARQGRQGRQGRAGQGKGKSKGKTKKNSDVPNP